MKSALLLLFALAIAGCSSGSADTCTNACGCFVSAATCPAAMCHGAYVANGAYGGQTFECLNGAAVDAATTQDAAPTDATAQDAPHGG